MPAILTQSPAPGSALIRHAGDHVSFLLETPGPATGRAFLRTNLRNPDRRRAEVIAAVEQGAPRPGLDWEDLPMTPYGAGRWVLPLPLPDVGVFEAKAYLLENDHAAPLWPDGGGNTRIKVEPAWTVAENSIYAAFPRLYRPPHAADATDETLAPLDLAGYTVIPPSGTFRELRGRLDHILTDMGFRIVLVLPPFPVPTTHARMGRYGSPFAATDFYSVDPALAEFDQHTTPLEQFMELADGIHARGGRLFIDIPINHTGWASRLMTAHPEWFVRNADGSFHSPGAWGVTWADLVKLDYAHTALWREMADVFLHWCRQGVDGFRCDAGYFVPGPVWEYITAKVRQEFPDTVFLLEGLGGPIPVMLDLLTAGGLNWAYSELFQNEDRGATDWYVPQAVSQSATHGYQINFAETHDNSRLAAVSPEWARLRTAVAALCSPAGGWGLTCGAEWFAKEKIVVHGATDLNENAAANQVAEIALLRDMLRHPAFTAGAALTLITDGGGSGIALRRVSRDGAATALVLLNLDAKNAAEVTWKSDEFPAGTAAICLLSGRPIRIIPGENTATVLLEPGGYCVLGEAPAEAADSLPPCIAQEAAALAQRVERWLDRAPSAPDPACARALLADPAEFCRGLAGLPFAPVTETCWPRDQHRAVVWLPGDLLLITAESPFRYSVSVGACHVAEGHSLPGKGGHFTLVRRPEGITCPGAVIMRVPGEDTITRGELPLVLPGPLTEPTSDATGAEVRADPDLHIVLTNGTGAMSHLRAAWGTVRTQYDALLAANPHPDFPVDRRMLLNRCRAWIVRRGYSTELSALWIEHVNLLSQGAALWTFRLPCGDGQWMRLTAEVSLTPMHDSVRITFTRLPGDTAGPVRLVVRPDVEDRGFHEKWIFTDDNMAVLDDALTFAPGGFVMPARHGRLSVSLPGSDFIRQPERFTVEHLIDASRGLGAHSDLFSPGYFELSLETAAPAVLTATLGDSPPPAAVTAAPGTGFTLRDAIAQFIVKRDDSLTVIAGYPWFLDWGRDTLICLRGIAAAGELPAVRDILKTFARYEKQGTLPNMIRGGDDSNRDTSDAPLWFFVATADLLDREGSDSFLDENAGAGRTIREVLISLGRHYISGTPNGIRMDPASGLIFSPSHFTWMDTNYPAGTPRRGYPLCIQSFWHAALRLLARVDNDPLWPELAERVRGSIAKYYASPGRAWLSDCLHAEPGQSAAEAVADDHLRPNQLFAVTLGAVTDPAIAAGVITSSLELLVPGALRTLADRDVAYALPVENRGRLLNNPTHPYAGRYEGDEDSRRKPAYHNGTAWPWPMPMLAEAMVMTWGPSARARAEGILASSLPLFRRFSLGSLEEVLDGDFPHLPRGCGSQAWSVTEWLRVREYLRNTKV